jgi:hypothetical protein
MPSDEVLYEEDDDKMEDVPLAAMKVETVLSDNYGEDAAMTAVMAASLTDEEIKWSWLGLEDIVQLSLFAALF